MNFKSTLKFTLCASLLGAGVLAYAEGPVTLKGGGTVTWENFVGVLNGTIKPTATLPADAPEAKALNTAKAKYYGFTVAENGDSIPGTAEKILAGGALYTLNEKKNAYDIAKSEYEAQSDSLTVWQNELQTMSSDKDTPTWLSTASKNASDFNAAYKSATKGGNNSATAYYYYDEEDGVLYLSFADEMPTVAPYTGVKWEEEKIGALDLYKKLAPPSELYEVDVYLGAKYTVNNGWIQVYPAKYTQAIGMVSTEIANVVNSGKYDEDPNAERRTNLNNWIKDLSLTKQSNGKTKLQNLKATSDQAYAEYQTALTDANTAKSTLDSAQTAYNTAAAAAGTDAYQEVSLNEDITVSLPITKSFTGSINANGNVINVESLPQGTTSLFGTNFSGVLENAIINGAFAAQGRGTYHNVAVWRGTDGTYYDNYGTSLGACKTIGELGYKIRNNELASANIAKGVLIKWDSAFQTYSIQVCQPNIDPIQCYSNLESNTDARKAFINLGEYNVDAATLSPNTFFESATNDFGNVNNVIYNGTCKNVNIFDGESFYCPKQITATNLSYDREFVEGFNAVCLPFALSSKLAEGIDAVCEFDNENPTNNQFVFTYTESQISANTPVLIHSKTDGVTLNLTKVTLSQTPDDQLVSGGNLLNGTSTSHGTFKPANRGTFLGATQGFKIFGLNKSGNFQPANETATFKSFRMVIASQYQKVNAPAAPRSICIVNEEGVDITSEFMTGISVVEGINDDAAKGLSIVGGQGEINITSEADYGKVQVYNLNGGVAAIADVMAGTTSVNVQKGVYIVLGKKVMVK